MCTNQGRRQTKPTIVARFLRDFASGYSSPPQAIEVDQGTIEQSEGIVDLLDP